MLRIYLLGGFRAEIDGSPVAPDFWPRFPLARRFVSLLALAPQHRLHRDEIVDRLWPERPPHNPNNRLSQLRSQVQQALSQRNPAAPRYIEPQGLLVVLAPDGQLWTDVDAFLGAAHAAKMGSDPAAYQAAIDQYGGDLLPEDSTEPWVINRREDLRDRYVALLLGQAHLLATVGEGVQAEDRLQRVLTQAPANEQAHCGLMCLFAQRGERDRALQQFARLREALKREHDAVPSAESERLSRRIASGEFTPTAITPATSFPSGGAPHHLPGLGATSSALLEPAAVLVRPDGQSRSPASSCDQTAFAAEAPSATSLARLHLPTPQSSRRGRLAAVVCALALLGAALTLLVLPPGEHSTPPPQIAIGQALFPRWPQRATATGRMGYVDGEYEVVRSAGQAGNLEAWQSAESGGQRLTDFDLEIDARLVSGQDDANLYLLFRGAPRGDRYAFIVYPRVRRAVFWSISGGRGKRLLDHTGLEAIRPGDATNRLGVQAHGTTMVLQINGQTVWQGQDEASTAGFLGLAVATDSGDTVAARFGSLVVTVPAALQAAERMVEVSTDRPWQDTGIQINRGDRVRIEYVAGQWTYGVRDIPPHDGSGGPDYVCAEVMEPSRCVELVPDFKKGALIGRVGSQILRIGNLLEFTAEATGPLQLSINDGPASFDDNAGSITVRVTIQGQ